MSRMSQHSQSGFTLVEVMIAIGIMTVGSLGILSMHHAVSGANRSANEMNTAIAITEKWLERIDRDSLAWSEEGVNSSALQSTAYLSELAGSLEPTGWVTPSTTNPESYAFDYRGRDDPDLSDVKYCVNLRMSWLRQGSSARVDIRTFWYREGYVHGGANHAKWVSGSDFRGANCDAATADGWDLGQAPNVNVVFASTVVRWLRREGT
ncbi:MAG: prepilin-type N-terminal cleavage/methylation domain-containing protein [Myxococcales bacterium]|nr:MAG: prepilin-type N-terminal cleavage/methylation domain-containing protein [Myxococcales bacterium]